MVRTAPGRSALMIAASAFVPIDAHLQYKVTSQWCVLHCLCICVVFRCIHIIHVLVQYATTSV